MSEQPSLNFDAPKQNPYEAMSLGELKALYKEKVGVAFRPGRSSREQLIFGIQNPKIEEDELRALDAVSSEDDIIATYRH